MSRTFNAIVFATATVVILSGSLAWGQADSAATASQSDHNATNLSGQTPPAVTTAPSTTQELFNNSPQPDGGWQGLANVLEALTPSVDTRIPLTPSQITDRITNMINQGRYDEALEVIEKRKLQRKEQNLMGADVQLFFLEGRALSESGQSDKAIAVYHDLTVHYPELPEPWNNLSAEYVRKNNLEMAEQALQTSLSINPNYGTAQLNLGIVQLMRARESFNRAARLGVSEARGLASQTTRILQP